MLVKVQRDITGTGLLIYNEDKSMIMEFHDEEAEKLNSMVNLKPMSRGYFDMKFIQVEDKDW